MSQICELPRLLHILPFATLGGTEKDCLYFVEASKNKYHHQIWVLGENGPMINQWLEAGATVNLLNILSLSQRNFIKQLETYSGSDAFDGILYWSTIKLPMVRYALRNQRCRIAVHVGNPANFRLKVMLKQMIDHILFPSPLETCLFACSHYVLRSLSVHPYYRQFKATVSHNPVRLLNQNPYVAKPIAKDTEIIMGMTARLDPIKDHRTLLLAFQKVLLHYPFARLWLMGDGVLRNQLEQLAHQLGISDSVVFWGNVENVYEKLQQLDLFVYSTTPKEGLGNALAEAMACGVPCVVADLPMMHEVAGSNSSILFFQSGNADDLKQKIIYILENEYLRKEISQNVFERASTAFDATRYVKERIDFLFETK